MKKKDSASPSRFPGASASSASQRSPSSPWSPRRSPRRASPSLQERLSSGDDGSPRNPEAPLKFQSLIDIHADCDRCSLKFKIKLSPGLNFSSSPTAKCSGADDHGDSLKIPPELDVRPVAGIQPSDSSPGVREKETALHPLYYEQMVGNVLEDYVKQEIVDEEYRAALRSYIDGPVASPPRPSGPGQRKGMTGPNYKGPDRKSPGSRFGSSKKPKNAAALQSQDGRGGSHKRVITGGPEGSRSGPAEPSQATPACSTKKPGRWIELKSERGKGVWIKLSKP